MSKKKIGFWEGVEKSIKKFLIMIFLFSLAYIFMIGADIRISYNAKRAKRVIIENKTFVENCFNSVWVARQLAKIFG